MNVCFLINTLSCSISTKTELYQMVTLNLLVLNSNKNEAGDVG